MTTEDKADEFLVFSWGRRPLLAFPARFGRRMAAAAFACYPAHTAKKKLLRQALRTMHAGGLGALLSRRTTRPLREVSAEDWGQWCGSLGGEPVIVWPNDPARARVYVHVLDKGGSQKVFAKLAFDEANAKLIRNERAALESVRAVSGGKFEVPRVLSSGTCPAFSHVCVSALPDGLRMLSGGDAERLESVMRVYPGSPRRVSGQELEQMAWWRAFRAKAESYPDFVRSVEARLRNGISVCRVHGDLNETNVLADGKKLWLLDWERSSSEGPVRTDEICRQADQRWAATRCDPCASVRDFRRACWDGKSAEEQTEVLAALAFLTAAEFTPVTMLVENWGSGG